MTRIQITPLVQQSLSAVRVPARLTALPSYANRVSQEKVTFAELLTFDIGEYSPPYVDLEPPEVGTAWTLGLTSGAQKIVRTVVFSGTAVTWEQLTDVDPATLTPIPANEALAAWIAVRDTLLSTAAEQLDAHRMSLTPHPVYDNAPDLSALFDTQLDSGDVTVPDSEVPDFTTLFDESL